MKEFEEARNGCITSFVHELPGKTRHNDGMTIEDHLTAIALPEIIKALASPARTLEDTKQFVLDGAVCSDVEIFEEAGRLANLAAQAAIKEMCK